MDRPLGTFTVETETTGICHVPDVFHDSLSMAVASLDFARVWNTQGNRDMTTRELESAAQHFYALARKCEAMSDRSDFSPMSAPNWR